jgi:hypothetical protein
MNKDLIRSIESGGGGLGVLHLRQLLAFVYCISPSHQLFIHAYYIKFIFKQAPHQMDTITFSIKN